MHICIYIYTERERENVKMPLNISNFEYC